jgi:putative ATP-binding cassette transporter
MKNSRPIIAFVIVLGIFDSLLHGGLLFFITSAISDKPLFTPKKYNWVLFVAIIVSSLVITKIFQMYMIRLTNNILYDLEVEILSKLRYSSFDRFESLGNEMVYNAINDAKVLAYVPQVFLNAFNSIVIILCCIGYLFWISWFGCLCLLLLMSGLLIFYLIRNRDIEKELNTKRTLENQYYRYLDDMLKGFRELKMNSNRHDRLFDHFLIRNRLTGRDISIASYNKYLDNELTGSYSWYIIIGVILFVLPGLVHLTGEKTSGFLIAVLYLIGPITLLISLIPTYTVVKIALERLDVFEDKIGAALDGKRKQSVPMPDVPFESIRFEGVTFVYNSREIGQSFLLEPIDLLIQRGEVVFITGGNGSGKSTFGYLLTGLYRPGAGSIYLNGSEVTEDNRASYRDLISAIFSDNYLFNENYDEFDLGNSNRQLLEFIELLQMTHILKPDEGKNKMDKALSRGQQKRLALIYALLENKQIIFMDEWAAEQDPRFRAYFYNTVLPKLKEMGKTVILITHDDDYYRCASRIIKFNYGRIVSDTLTAAFQEARSFE